MSRLSPVPLSAYAYFNQMTNPIDDPLLSARCRNPGDGLATATYELAILVALIDHCVEHLPDTASDTLVVPIPDLAHRVLEIYGRQVRPFEGQELRQSTPPRARILIAAATFRSLARGIASLYVAIVRARSAYKAAIREPFKATFGAQCFYCGTHLHPDNPIDHVLPWSLVGIGGLTNLVPACTAVGPRDCPPGPDTARAPRLIPDFRRGGCECPDRNALPRPLAFFTGVPHRLSHQYRQLGATLFRNRGRMRYQRPWRYRPWCENEKRESTN